MARTEMGSRLQLSIATDAMSAELCLPANCAEHLLNLDACTDLLHENGLKLSPDMNNALEQGLIAAQQNPAAPFTIRLTGLPPVHGTDACLKWEPKCDPAEPSTPTDMERIDFYNRVRYVHVKQGQKIATIIAATAGEPGMDVTGRLLKPRPGRDVAITIDAATVIRGADGSLTAANDGMIDLRDGVLSISRCLQVEDYVDFSTGNIDFEGDVHVQRGVRDRFVVRATGDIHVFGLIEAAIIEAGGALHAHTGMAAKGGGRITVGGDLEANYLEHVIGSVKGHATVRRAMLYCALDVEGDLRLASARLIGGMVHVTGSAEIGELGATGDDSTTLVLGHLPEIRRHLAAAGNYLDHAHQRLRELEARLQYHAATQRIVKQREELTVLLHERETLLARIARIHKKRELLLSHMHRVRRVDLTIHRTLHADTTIVLDETAYLFLEAVSGPIWIGPDSHQDLVVKDLRRHGVTPITLLARAQPAEPHHTHGGLEALTVSQV